MLKYKRTRRMFDASISLVYSSFGLMLSKPNTLMTQVAPRSNSPGKLPTAVSWIDIESLSQVVLVRRESGSPRQARTAADKTDCVAGRRTIRVECKERVMMYYVVSAGYCIVQASATPFAAPSDTTLCEFLRHVFFSLQSSSSPRTTTKQKMY